MTIDAKENLPQYTLNVQTLRVMHDPMLIGIHSQDYERITLFAEADTSNLAPVRENNIIFAGADTSGSAKMIYNNSTSWQPIPETLEVEVVKLFDSADIEAFEYGYKSQFAESLERFVQQYGTDAVKAIKQSILGGNVNADVTIETFHTLGRMRHKSSHAERFVLLLWGLFSQSSRIRSGAALGLASLDDPKAIPFLRKVIEFETSRSAEIYLQRVLEQLEDTQRNA